MTGKFDNMKCEFTKEEVEAEFKNLEKVLADKPLRREDGGTSLAKAGEFMLMHKQGDKSFFKHHNTRNYVVVQSAPVLSLIVPTYPDKPFFHGEF